MALVTVFQLQRAMNSHEYAGRVWDLIRIAAAPLAGLVFWGGIFLAGDWTGLWPPAQPLQNPDTALLAIQSQASRTRHPAQIVLTGDSSCLTGVDALELSRRLPGQPTVINLGLILGLNLDVYAETCSRFLKANPGQVRAVILLVSPQKLRDENDSPYHHEVWRALVEGGPGAAPGTTRTIAMPAATRFREQLQVLQAPLPGSAAEFYGFLSIFREYAAEHHGSIVDPSSYRPPPRPEEIDYFLSPTLEEASRRWRNSIPSDVRLIAGIMPVPEAHISEAFEIRHQELLQAWNRWLQADHLLTNLPARLPDGLFATGAHLNQRGQQYFTELLGRELALGAALSGRSSEP